ncbi:MAG: radical SAM protein [Eubacteriales bacterium]|nr:radical SAM protein [Eubacteriales bacterium]
MAKNDNPHATRLMDSLNKHGKERDAQELAERNPLSKSATFEKKFAWASKKATEKRKKAEKNGEHIPAFLISSITSGCNLHCAGCYSRQNHACSDEAPVNQLSGEDWNAIFDEVEELGISFILLAGGEPLLRPDVIDEAAKHKNILFPIFTNGFFVADKYIDMFDKHRNLVPIISIEGDKQATDSRRGEGVYDKVVNSMQKINEKDLIFGVSVTVTTENMDEVYSREFIDHLLGLGCKAIIYVEFVPVTEEAKHLAPGEEERERMKAQLDALRKDVEEMVFISFPGDEKSSGGCVAAGRGFFHINSHGGAEPCPFSPYSDINVKETSLREALKSKLFYNLQAEGLLNEDHAGGCILFEKREQVEKLLAK